MAGRKLERSGGTSPSEIERGLVKARAGLPPGPIKARGKATNCEIPPASLQLATTNENRL